MVYIHFEIKKKIILYNFKSTIIIDCYKNYFNDRYIMLYKCNDTTTHCKSNIIISGVVFSSSTADL